MKDLIEISLKKEYKSPNIKMEKFNEKGHRSLFKYLKNLLLQDRKDSK